MIRENPFIVCCLTVMSFMLAGCGEAPRQYTGERVPTTPVTGRVLIDGEPIAGVAVAAIPEDPSGNKSGVITPADGTFTLGTYDGGDGIPAGSYAMTFQWKKLGAGPGGSYDQLRGRYADPAHSEYKFTVVDGEPVEFGDIKLTTN